MDKRLLEQGWGYCYQTVVRDLQHHPWQLVRREKSSPSHLASTPLRALPCRFEAVECEPRRCREQGEGHSQSRRKTSPIERGQSPAYLLWTYFRPLPVRPCQSFDTPRRGQWS